MQLNYKQNIFKAVLSVAIASFLFASGCSVEESNSSFCADSSQWHTKSISDLQKIPQDFSALSWSYSKEAIETPAIVNIKENFMTKWFHLWDDNCEYKSDYIFAKNFENEEYFGQNLRPFPEKIKQSILKDADLNNFPNLKNSKFSKAITVRHSVVRVIPFEEQLFYAPWKGGEGFPFDMTVMTEVTIGLPVKILHRSLSGKYVYCLGPTFYGWIKTDDIAYVSSNLEKRLRKMELYGVKADEVALYNKNGDYLGSASIGTLLPKKADRYYLPVKNDAGYAVLKEIKTDKIAKNLYSHPEEFTLKKLSEFSNALIDVPYSWGSVNRGRDCSGLVQDLFINFGIIFKRNSSEQKNSLVLTDISSYSAKEKLEFLSSHGKPMQTLLFMPGHVMIYAGTYNDEPIIFHSAWGLPAKSPLNDTGRFIIGKSALTTLTAGKEIKEVEKDKLWIDRITHTGMLDSLSE